MRRVFKSLFLVACLTLSIHATKNHQNFKLYDFSKGLDSYHNPTTLPDGFVQDSNNVLFDDKTPVSKRLGFSSLFTSSMVPQKTAWTYTDPNNTLWILYRIGADNSSSEINAVHFDGTGGVTIATPTISNLVGETNAFGNAFFVDQGQGVYYTGTPSGFSSVFVNGSPKGSLITTFHGRIWVAGLAAPNGNQLYSSAYSSGTVWTTGLNPTDPVLFQVGLQDNFDNITALYVYLDTLYIFKHSSIYALYGFDQTSFQVSQLTQECGCIDQNSIQTFNGGL